MGYRRLVQANVKMAFKAIGDLAVDVTLAQKTNTTFDFTTQTSETAPAINKTIKAVFTKKGREKDSENTLKGELLLQSTDINDGIVYATAKINGTVWNLVQPYEDNGYITTIAVVRNQDG